MNKLLGRGAGTSAAAAVEPTAYEGFHIIPTPQSAGGQWRLAGRIIKATEGEPLEYAFVRADTFANRDEAVAFAIRKGKQLVDEQGDRLFESA
ncbi:MAG: HlyU family transcriptional regulator [Pseudomonadota bacterium]